MQDRDYLTLRRVSFWVFSLAFLILTPVILFYSLGYKFDTQAHKLQKTGALTIKSSPKDVEVRMDGVRVSKSTPCTQRNLLPKTYHVVLQRENFYSYQVKVDVRSAEVSEIDAALIPYVRHVDQLLPVKGVFKFFIVPQMFGKKIYAFARDGLYEVGENLETPQRIAALSLDDATLKNLSGFIEGNTQLAFWDPKHVWLVQVTPKASPDGLAPVSVLVDYTAIPDESLVGVFWGLKEKYAIVRSTLRIFALDVNHPQIKFPLFTLQSPDAKVIYDSDSETLYIDDHLPGANDFSLFRIALQDLINENDAHQKNP